MIDGSRRRWQCQVQDVDNFQSHIHKNTWSSVARKSLKSNGQFIHPSIFSTCFLLHKAPLHRRNHSLTHTWGQFRVPSSPHARLLHTESTQTRESNLQPSWCEATVWTTVPPCCPIDCLCTYKIFFESWTERAPTVNEMQIYIQYVCVCLYIYIHTYTCLTNILRLRHSWCHFLLCFLSPGKNILYQFFVLFFKFLTFDLWCNQIKPTVAWIEITNEKMRSLSL